MNTIQDMIKAIKELQVRVTALEAKPKTPIFAPPEVPPFLESTIRRGRPRRAVEGEDVI